MTRYEIFDASGTIGSRSTIEAAILLARKCESNHIVFYLKPYIKDTSTGEVDDVSGWLAHSAVLKKDQVTYLRQHRPG